MIEGASVVERTVGGIERAVAVGGESAVVLKRCVVEREDQPTAPGDVAVVGQVPIQVVAALQVQRRTGGNCCGARSCQSPSGPVASLLDRQISDSIHGTAALVELLQRNILIQRCRAAVEDCVVS